VKAQKPRGWARSVPPPQRKGGGGSRTSSMDSRVSTASRKQDSSSGSDSSASTSKRKQSVERTDSGTRRRLLKLPSLMRASQTTRVRLPQPRKPPWPKRRNRMLIRPPRIERRNGYIRPSWNSRLGSTSVTSLLLRLLDISLLYYP
jgi:hypothetical protein